MSITEKLDACTAELGIGKGDTIPKRLAAIADVLGLSNALSGKSILQQTDLCYGAIFGAPTPPVVAGIAIPVDPAEVTPNVPGMPMTAPAPMAMEGNGSGGEGGGGEGAPAHNVPSNGAIFDRSMYANGGPRGDQNLPCLTVCCAAPFAICPTHCLSAWGCDGPVDWLTSLPCKQIPCSPCDPNSKNPLWCCAEPLGWAASFGQLHTVMALVKNGAIPETKNGAGQDAYSDAGRERHTHVVKWLRAWDAAGRPRARWR